MRSRIIDWLALPVLLAFIPYGSAPANPAESAPCSQEADGLKLAEGLCTAAFARDAGPVRNLVVAPNGDLFVALRARKDESQGGVLALRDADGDGRAERRERFGEGDAHGIQLTGTHLYLATREQVVRWSLAGREIEPNWPPEVIV